MDLSPQALDILRQLFSEQSQLSLPVGVAAQVIEIRAWVQAEITKEK